ncbi:hypothetical protein [Actinomadura decatromicini]|uniref:5,10-methylene-tetrahydrofolate dehydrogenase n=1 Tax=Actinomadura decatromicini TaxID=2604572 RepID=A0A5D3F7D0_9ACTN|nr:hypothetical protein [Actinomadura decatromicini]TYK44093.1 hypothetical protein FXF68_35885 [Actinomadura decatromicini]
MADDVVRVVLRADPGLPLEIAREIAETLPDDMRKRTTVDWEADAEPGAFTADEQVEAEHLADALADQFPSGTYDIAVFVTDLPRRYRTQPILAEVSRTERIALLSLPALGWFHRPSRARRGVADLITLIYDGTPPRFAREYTVRQADAGQQPEQRFVTPGLLGRLRLLSGMIRANRPWRLFAGLSKALAGVLATAAFAVVNSTIWNITDALGPIRQAVLAVLAVVALLAWLIIDHQLWERPDDVINRQRAKLYNAVTLVTLLIGVLCLYMAVFALTIVLVPVVLTGDALRSSLDHGAEWSFYLSIAWLTTSMGMAGGALGSGLEDESAVREAAYGIRQRSRLEQQGKHHAS